MGSKKGCFIVFEGIDGSGKSTQISLLQEHIQEHSINCMTTMEPSNGPIGTLRRQFRSGRIKGEEPTLTALFAADRLDHLNNPVNGICKLLDDGIAVLSDRYVFSNYAYQSVSVPLEWIMKCNEMANEIVRPDCHIFIDVSPETAMERVTRGRHQTDIYETKERLTDVRDRYLDLIHRMEDVENIIIVDGNRSPQEISDDIWAKVCHYFV